MSQLVADSINIYGRAIPSQATIDLENAVGNILDVSGTSTISRIILYTGHQRLVRFTGVLTLEHSAALVLPNGTNITTAVGDYAIFQGYERSVTCAFYSNLTGVPSASGWLNVKDYGAVGNGVTDDTASIQLAINAAHAMKVAVVFFPLGTYLCNGALQGTAGDSAAFSRLRYPVSNVSDGNWRMIEFRGAAPPPRIFGTVAGGLTTLPNQGSIIKSTANGGALFGLEPTSQAGYNFNGTTMMFRDLVVRTKDNPTQTAIDASYAVQLSMEDVHVDTGIYSFAAAEPTTAGITGIKTPGLSNAASTTLNNVGVSGYYDGFLLEEHSSGDNLYAHSCKRGYVFGTAGHGMNFGRILEQNCEIGLHFAGSSRITIAHWGFERGVAPHWSERLYDISSAASPSGTINYNGHISGDGTALKSLLLSTPDDINSLQVKQIGGASIAFLDCQGTTQQVASGTAPLVSWTYNHLSYGNGFTWSIADPTNVYANFAGLYHVSAVVAFEPNAVGIRHLTINTTIWQAHKVGPQTTAVAGEPTYAVVDSVVYLRAGDAVSINARQTSGSTLAIQDLGTNHYASKLTIARVG